MAMALGKITFMASFSTGLQNIPIVFAGATICM